MTSIFRNPIPALLLFTLPLLVSPMVFASTLMSIPEGDFPLQLEAPAITEHLIECVPFGTTSQNTYTASPQLLKLVVGWTEDDHATFLELTVMENGRPVLWLYRVGPARAGTHTAFQDRAHKVYLEIESRNNTIRQRVNGTFQRTSKSEQDPLDAKLLCNLLYRNYYPMHFIP